MSLAKAITDITETRLMVSGMEEDFCMRIGKVMFEYRNMCDEIIRELIRREGELQKEYDKETGAGG